jgi:hypothetical protein
MRTLSPTSHRSVTHPEMIPITPEAFRWLEMEVDRLAAMVNDESPTAWMKSQSGDSDAPTFMVNGDFELLVRRLGKLRAAMASSQVTRPDGSAMVGTWVTVRDEDGLLESYVLVTPAQPMQRFGASHRNPPWVLPSWVDALGIQCTWKRPWAHSRFISSSWRSYESYRAALAHPSAQTAASPRLPAQ